MNDIKKHLRVGPGGFKCACCAPAPGSHERRKMFRCARRRAKAMDIELGLNDYLDEVDSDEDQFNNPCEHCMSEDCSKDCPFN